MRMRLGYRHIFCDEHGETKGREYCIECCKEEIPKEFKWICSGYYGCSKDIEPGEKAIFCFSAIFPDRVEIYHERCFERIKGNILIDGEEPTTLHSAIVKDSYKVEIHKRPLRED